MISDIDTAWLVENYGWLFLVLALGVPNFKQGVIALNQWVNTRMGGSADETLSARAWRLRLVSVRWRLARVVIDALFFWEEQHCLQAWRAEIDRKHSPSVYRGLIE